MAEFTADLPSFRPSFPLLDIDPNVENLSVLTTSDIDFQSFMSFSNDKLFGYHHQAPEFTANMVENFPGSVHQFNQNVVPVADQPTNVAAGNEFHESRKRKSMDDKPENSSGTSSPPVSETGTPVSETGTPVSETGSTKRKNSSAGRGKRLKSNEKEEEKLKEVVHVRARRGQATDSHSLAERVRRGKINERLRCLQDIVPGCYKSMGMAVMLDEIINYVQSLQNQVEFLSMKLTAASSFYDFNSETDALETMQRAKAYEAKELERLMKEGYGGLACFHSTWSL